MNKRGLNLIFTAVLVILLSSNANAELSFSTQETEKSICQSTTDVFTLFIKGTGNIIIEKEGTASSFSTIIPSSFETAVEKPVFVYITPNSKIQPDSYNLNLKIKDSSSEKIVPLKITVKNCNTFEVSGELSKEVCSCNSQTYEYTIRNTGMYKETYSISVNGNAKSLVELDKKEVTIDPGKSSKIVATVKTACNDKGTKDFTLKIESKANKAVASVDNSIKINSCNDYTLKVTGPTWANLDKEKLSVNSKNKGIANLILTPDYGVEGDFDIKLGIESKSGNVNKENIIKVNVRKCNSISLEATNPSEIVCQSTIKNIPIKIKNTGEVNKTLQLSADSDWVSIEEEINVESSKEREVQLKLSPEISTPTGKYTVIVKAKSLDDSNIAEEISIEVQVTDVEKCYKPSIETKDKIEVLKENIVTSYITVENKGEEKADYEVSVTGTASEFIQINPSTITLESKQSEVMQIYIAPTIRTELGTYFATISVKGKGSSISDNKEITIEVKDSEENNQLTGKVTKNLKEFKKETTIRESTEFMLNGEEHKLEIQEVNEDSVTIKISSDPIFLVLNISESREVDVNEDGNNDLKVTLESIENGNPTIKVIEINSNEVKENNGSLFSKYRNWIIGLIIVIILIVLASVFFSDDEEEEKEEDKEEKIRIGRYIVGLIIFGVLYWLFKKYSVLQKVNLYKFYIILGIAILIVLVLITKYWNSIINFFEEEETEEEIKEKVKEVIEKKENAEEEKVEVKEEPKKKVVKKKTPKK